MGKLLRFATMALITPNNPVFPRSGKMPVILLHKPYEGAGDFRNALLFLHRYTTFKDLFNSLEKAKTISKKIFQFEFKKRAFADSLRIAKVNEVKDVKREEEIRQQEMFTRAGVIGFILVVIIAILFIFSRMDLQISSAQKKEINSNTVLSRNTCLRIVPKQCKSKK